MTESKPIWWDWLDKSTPVGMPINLLPNAPEKMKKSFREWQKKREEYNKGWGNTDKKGKGITDKEVQELIERINKEIS